MLFIQGVHVRPVRIARFARGLPMPAHLIGTRWFPKHPKPKKGLSQAPGIPLTLKNGLLTSFERLGVLVQTSFFCQPSTLPPLQPNVLKVACVQGQTQENQDFARVASTPQKNMT